jgi:cell division protein FtsB
MRIINFCIRYKYVLTCIVFLLYLFFGNNNIIENRRKNRKIKNLENELQHYKAAVANLKTQKNLSVVNTEEEREEYFRKHHYLKKEDEDIFRIVYENENRK